MLTNGKFVGGEGQARGILFLGEGPEAEEEKTGRPFVGESEESIVRQVIQKLGMEPLSYFTHIVSCRSCVQDTNAGGEPMFYQHKGIKYPKYKDQPATQPQVQACKQRLYEEIYLVDPLVIVALGAAAASALLNRPVSLIKEAGTEQEITIPGVLHTAVRTEKRGVWGRVAKGELHLPTIQNEVKYLMIPTYSAYFLRVKLADMSACGPFQQFKKHLKAVLRTYERLAEYHGIKVPDRIQIEES
jgi:uracil-DNA glycosylase